MLQMLNPDVRIIGTDWKGKEYTGHDLTIKMYWHNRNHNWSTSNLRKRIYMSEKEKEAKRVKYTDEIHVNPEDIKWLSGC